MGHSSFVICHWSLVIGFSISELKSEKRNHFRQIHHPIHISLLESTAFGAFLNTSKVLDARRRGATTEAYEAIRRKASGPEGLRPGGRSDRRQRRRTCPCESRDDALMGDQECSVPLSQTQGFCYNEFFCKNSSYKIPSQPLVLSAQRALPSKRRALPSQKTLLWRQKQWQRKRISLTPLSKIST